jgi:hypothetical protein
MMRVHTRVVWQWRDGVLVELPEEGQSYDYWGPVALAGSGTPNVRQIHYRVRTDADAVDSAPTWGAAEDTSYEVPLDTNIRVRVSFENTGTAAGAPSNPSFARGPLATAPSNYSTSTILMQAVDGSSSADATAVTVARLTAGAGTFQNGAYDEDGSQSVAITASFYTEYENAIKLVGADVGGGELFRLRWRSNVDTIVVDVSLTTAEQTGSDFQPGAQLGGASANTANSATLSMTTANAATTGQLVVVCIACDNNGTTDADHSEIASVSINGETGVKAVEYTNGQGSAQAGATASIWYKVLAGDMAAGSTITATFTTSTTNGDNNAMKARAFTVASGKTVSVEAINGNATDGTAASPTALSATTANIECLRVCAIAAEGSAATVNSITLANQFRATSSVWSPWWTSGSSFAQGTGTIMCVMAESNISTGTALNSQVRTSLGSVDWACAYVAFKATASAATTAPPGHPIGIGIVAPNAERSSLNPIFESQITG